MRWEDENYVRVYTRDTVSWKLLSWEARALFVFICRKVDRAGVMDVGPHGCRGVAAVVEMPVDVVERALPELTTDGCIREADQSLVIPNFIEAQEAKMSPKLRAKLYRDRRKVRGELLGEPQASEVGTTEGNSPWPGEGPSASRSVTEDNASVTQSHSTLSYAEPSNATLRKGVEDKPPSSLRDSSGGSEQETLFAGSEPGENTVQEKTKGSGAPKRKPRQKRSKQASHPGFKSFVDGFTELFKAARSGADPAWGAKQGKMVKTVLDRSKGDVELALSRARRMFEMSPKWPAENPDLQTLVGHWDKFAPPMGEDATVGRVEPRNFDEYPEAGTEEEGW